MPRLVVAVRIVLVVTGVVNLLLTTVLFSSVGRPFTIWWFRTFSAPQQDPPAWLMSLIDSRFMRASGAVAGLLALALAWFAGTPDGEALVLEFFQ
jgi:hypothetical protein